MQDYYDHIEAYIEGQLSVEDRKAFASAMETDASLQLAVANYGDAKRLSEGLLEADLLQTISNLDKKNDNHSAPPAPKKTPNKLWGLLLAIAIVGLASWLYMKNKKVQENKEWFAENYVRPIDPDATKSIDTVGMDMLQKGKFFFTLNDFEQSERWLLAHVNNSKDEDSISKGYFWLGAAYIEQGENAKAKKAWSKSKDQRAIK